MQHAAAGPPQAHRHASIAGIARIVRIAGIVKIGCRMRGVRPPGAFYTGGGALLLKCNTLLQGHPKHTDMQA